MVYLYQGMVLSVQKEGFYLHQGMVISVLKEWFSKDWNASLPGYLFLTVLKSRAGPSQSPYSSLQSATLLELSAFNRQREREKEG